MTTDRLATEHKPIFVARQPIYDSKTNVFGYELLFRSSAENNNSAVTPANCDMATTTVIADGFALAFNGIKAGKKAFINFSSHQLLSDSVYALPKDICVVEVLESDKHSQETLNALRTIKSNGYSIALANFTGRCNNNDMFSLADIIKVNMIKFDHDKMNHVTKNTVPNNCLFLAEKIEDRVSYNIAKGLGCTLFQGFYFSSPEIMSGNKSPILGPAKLDLLRILASEEFDVRELTNSLSLDPGLCYRLFQFINSAAFSLRTKIQSLQQALLLLGRKQLRQWLLAVLITDIQGIAVVRDAVYTSLQRARYLENMAHAYNNPLYPAESFFLLGLFSKLDMLLGAPFPELLGSIPLVQGIKNALLKIASPYLDWLILAQNIEQGAWEEVKIFLKSTDISLEVASRLHAESIDWVHKVQRCTQDN